MNVLDVEITRYKVEQVLRYLKNKKASGMDDIPYELHKWGGASMVDLLVQWCRTIWSNKKASERWNVSRVIFFCSMVGISVRRSRTHYKKEPILITNTVGKIFCMILNERLKTILK